MKPDAEEILLPGQLQLNGQGIESIDEAARQLCAGIPNQNLRGARITEVENDLNNSFGNDMFWPGMKVRLPPARWNARRRP